VILVAADRVRFQCRTILPCRCDEAAPVGDKDVCLRQEQEAHDQLVRQWTQFPVADNPIASS